MRWVFRVATLVAVLAVLAGSLWLVWALVGVRIVAAAGIGPVDGVVTVVRCYQTTDSDGNDDGIDCQGQYTPADAVGPGRAITLSDAKESYPAGQRVEVRLAGGRAFQDSGFALIKYGMFAAVLLALGVSAAGWLVDTVRRGEAGSDGFLPVFCIGPLAVVAAAVPVLLIVVGVRALIR
ncbi:hypothetical protein [Kitasatospora sp. NPDC050463]|uniref:hypothetical protein n=1 Tax=Kitasatospora sp. NPDC050463 TaxID=3155786 RepID=UPI0033FED43C